MLEGAVLMAQLGQINEDISTLLADVTESIDEIVKGVIKLVSNCPLKSSRTTISFISQVLYEEIGYKGVPQEELSVEDFFIDQVK